LFKSKSFLIGVAVSALLLFLFLRQTNFGEMWQALKEAKYVFLIPALFIRLIGVYFRSLRWKFFLKPLGNFSSIRLFPLVVIGFMVNNLLPGRLGIVARAYILGEKENVSKMEVGGTVVAEQVFDGVMLILFALSIAIFVPLSGWVQQGVYIATGLFLGALLVCFVLVFSKGFAHRMVGLVLIVIPKKWRGKVEEWLLRLIDGLQFMRSPKKLLISLVLSVLIWLCEAGMFYMAGLAFDLQQPFYIMLLITAVASLSWAFMFVAPAGVGVFEYSCKELLKPFVPVGIAATISAYVIVLHALIVLPMVALGFVFLWKENLSLAKVIGSRHGQEKKQGSAVDKK
jgi:uncharacterized protein (TIRG00374 family)